MVTRVENKKSWFARHPVWAGVLGVIAFLFILGIIIPDTPDNEADFTISTESQQLNSEIKKPVNVYSMNQNVPVDELLYQVTGAETFTSMGTTYFSKETDGNFVKVYLRITNNGQETEQIFTPRFRIEDSRGRKYDRLSDDAFYIADGIEFGKQLQPSLATSGAIVFEMPKDSNSLKLVIVGDWLSDSEVKIELSGIEDIGTDKTLQEEQDRQYEEALADAEKKTQELLSKCNSPFVCTSSCSQYMDVGQKDCSSGEVCCLQN